MPANRNPARKGVEPKSRAYPGEKARQGDIVLRSRTQRWIFIGGLVLGILVVLLIRLTS